MSIDNLATKYLELADNEDIMSTCMLEGIKLACDAMPQTLPLDREPMKRSHVSKRLDFKHQWTKMLENNWSNIEFA